jgi:hypothetical protein
LHENNTFFSDAYAPLGDSCKRISVAKICFTLKLQKKALQIHYKTVPKSFRKKSVPFYKRYRFVSDPFYINSFCTEIAKKKRYKFVTKPFQNRSVRKAFHFTNVTDSFQIRLTFVTAEYASWEI